MFRIQGATPAGKAGCVLLILLAFGLLFMSRRETKNTKTVILAVTTSVQDTGLLDVLAERFNGRSDYTLKPIAVGSGQALQLGKQGEADMLLVHSPEDETIFVREGFGLKRTPLMYNEFILVGPPHDPARVNGARSITEAFIRISLANQIFVSRGDNSGTHQKELSIWKEADCSPFEGKYLEAGQGMAQTLRIAEEKLGYCLADRATYLALGETIRLRTMCEGDARLKNIYSLIPINPEVSPKVNAAAAEALYDYLLSREVGEIIENFKKEIFRRQLFFSVAGREDGVH